MTCRAMALSEGGDCHCEESDDEAISHKTKIASLLAMTRVLNFMPLPLVGEHRAAAVRMSGGSIELPQS